MRGRNHLSASCFQNGGRGRIMQMRSCRRQLGECGTSITPHTWAGQPETPRVHRGKAPPRCRATHDRASGEAGKTVLRLHLRACQTGTEPNSITTSEGKYGAGFNERAVAFSSFGPQEQAAPVMHIRLQPGKGPPRGSGSLANRQREIWR